MRDTRIRVYDNNTLTGPGVSITAPDDGSYPFANALNGKRRNLPWNPGVKTLTIEIDLGYSANVSLFSIMGPANSQLGLSPAAEVVIKGNMINLFDGSEPLSDTVTMYDNGVFHYLDDDDNLDGVQYRYWRIEIDDSTNPNDLFINYIFIGDALCFNHNISRGFTVDVVDQTIRARADTGELYSLQRPQYRQLGKLGIGFVNNAAKNNILSTVQEVGLHTPFIFSLDPTEKCFGPDFSHYLAYFDNLPKFTQVRVNDFNVDFDIFEVL